MRHSIPKWIDALLTAAGDETQRSGVNFLGETREIRVSSVSSISSVSSFFLLCRRRRWESEHRPTPRVMPESKDGGIKSKASKPRFT